MRCFLARAASMRGCCSISQSRAAYTSRSETCVSPCSVRPSPSLRIMPPSYETAECPEGRYRDSLTVALAKTEGALMPSTRNAATSVIVFREPCGTFALDFHHAVILTPRRAYPASVPEHHICCDTP